MGTTLSFVLIPLGAVPVAMATSYTYQSGPSATANWNDSAVWSPTGVPDAPGDEAVFIRPLVTPSGAFTITLPAAGDDTTVGSIVVDNTSYNNGNISRINTSGGKLIFQSTAGPATYTENAGTVANSPGRIEINAPIVLLSDLVITQDNIRDLNTGTIFSDLINGASNITITKEGEGGLQLNYGFALGSGEGFEGQFIINDGAIRLINAPGIAKSTGITVNSGGQLQLGQGSAGTVPNWTMAPGAVLNLNGNGKSYSGSNNAPDGALRFQTASGATSSFDNPVNLQLDARITSAPANSTAILSNVVSGTGDLIKSGPGTLSLTNSGNNYTGDTSVLAGGPLSITTPFLEDSADVYLVTGSALNLNFAGTDVIDSFFIDGVSQAEGTWGATGNLAADFQTELITGNGLLDVTTLVVPGAPGDYNDDGIVDAADYAVWRANDGGGTALPNDNGLGTPIRAEHYDLWVDHFGEMAPGSGGGYGSPAAAPEPASALLVLFALSGLLTGRMR
jgi:autotransporter-associated beta strand protein